MIREIVFHKSIRYSLPSKGMFNQYRVIYQLGDLELVVY